MQNRNLTGEEKNRRVRAGTAEHTHKYLVGPVLGLSQVSVQHGSGLHVQ